MAQIAFWIIAAILGGLGFYFLPVVGWFVGLAIFLFIYRFRFSDFN